MGKKRGIGGCHLGKCSILKANRGHCRSTYRLYSRWDPLPQISCIIPNLHKDQLQTSHLSQSMKWLAKAHGNRPWHNSVLYEFVEEKQFSRKKGHEITFSQGIIILFLLSFFKLTIQILNHSNTFKLQTYNHSVQTMCPFQGFECPPPIYVYTMLL